MTAIASFRLQLQLMVVLCLAATKSGAGSMAIGYTSVVMAAATIVVLLYFSF